MDPIYENEKVIDKHIKRPYWYRQVEPCNRYGEGLNLLLDILDRFLCAKDYHDRQENENRNIDKLGNHGLMFRAEGSEKILHCEVGFPFGRHTRAEENDPDVQVPEDLLCPAKALDPRDVPEDHIGKTGHYDDAEENYNHDVP
jgi:hypothetical protein